jgi:CubicO group peptidase (beta-lactamase class C family)
MTKNFVLILFVLSLGCKEKSPLVPWGTNSPVPPLPQHSNPVWPSPDWKEASPESQGMSSEKLKKVEDYAFSLTGTEEERKGIRSDGLVIIRNGHIVYEKYGRTFTKDTPHLIWSVTKSIVNTLYGIAERKGQISLNDPASKYIPSLNIPSHKDILLKDFMTMTSGLDANEGYESSPIFSTVVAMLYTRGRSDMGEMASQLGIRAPRGSYVYYSSLDSNVLMLALKNSLGKETYDMYPWKELFDPLGMKNVTFERDMSGTFVGSSYLYMTPRDLAKIGYLYNHDGVWNGKRLLPEGWVEFTRTPPSGYATTPYYKGLEETTYTAQWYSNQGVPEVGIPKALPDVPDDAFYGSGHWGQFLIVVPSKNLVVVRVGDDREKIFSRNQLMKLIIEAIQ